MEFYETDELGNQLDNWIGPSVSCLLAMCRAAGFARVELLHTTGYHAGVACFRKWEPVPAEVKRPAPEFLAVANTRTTGVNFSTRKEEYISCWFRTAQAPVTRDQLRLEVGGFGVPALYVRPDEGGKWMANFRLPPGLGSGWSPVRLRFADSAFGNTTLRIAVDQPLRVERLAMKDLCDGKTWRPGELEVSGGGFVACWVMGLPENCDRANAAAYLGESRLLVDYVGEPDANGKRQVNAVVPGETRKGEHLFRVECGGVSTGPAPLKVV